MISPWVVGGTVETVRSVFKTFMIIMIISEDDKPTHRGALLLARGPSGLLTLSFMLLRGRYTYLGHWSVSHWLIESSFWIQHHNFNQNHTGPYQNADVTGNADNAENMENAEHAIATARIDLPQLHWIMRCMRGTNKDNNVKAHPD